MVFFEPFHEKVGANLLGFSCSLLVRTKDIF